MGPMGPRGLGPIKQSWLKTHVSSGLQVPKRHFGILDVKTSLLALADFQTTFWDFGHLQVQKVDLFDCVRNTAMLVLVFYFFSKTCFF